MQLSVNWVCTTPSNKNTGSWFRPPPEVFVLLKFPILGVAGVLASAGLTALCLIYSVPIALLGSLALGLGLSIGFPATVSALGEAPGRGPQAIAFASMLAAGGSLFAAPSIGFCGGLMPLDRALLIVAVLLLLVVILAPFAQEQRLARPKAKKDIVTEQASR